MSYPSNLKYTKEHEWVLLSDDSETATIGVTHFAQKELGDIVFVETNNIGDVIIKNGIFGTVEAVKTVSDLFSPMSGEIIEQNSKLIADPALLNQDPYNEGWIVKIKIYDISEYDSLLNFEQYKELIGY